MQIICAKSGLFCTFHYGLCNGESVVFDIFKAFFFRPMRWFVLAAIAWFPRAIYYNNV